MKTNTRTITPPKYTHEGARAARISKRAELSRTVLTCMLWEKEFYEGGESIGDRIRGLVEKVDAKDCADIARAARHEQHIRHAPLWVAASMAWFRKGPHTRAAIESVVSRPDELGELISLYWKMGGRRPLPSQLKRGLADAFVKFDEYQLQKWDRAADVSLRDVMFLTHPKPRSAKQAAVFKRLAAREMKTANTWETKLSKGAHKKSKQDKRAVWEGLLRSGKLGYMALLKNLAGMHAAGVDEDLIRAALIARKGAHRIELSRYWIAAVAAPMFAREIDSSLAKAMAEVQAPQGKTAVLVDVSGSMLWKPTPGIKMWGDPGTHGTPKYESRLCLAAQLAALMPGNKRVFTFSSGPLFEAKAWTGLAGVESIMAAPNLGRATFLDDAIKNTRKLAGECDRLIVISDEQSSQYVEQPTFRHNYAINVAPNANGVLYGPKWVHVDGISERLIKYICAYERQC